MSRASRREIKKTFQKDIVEFLKVQKHFNTGEFARNLCLVLGKEEKGYLPHQSMSVWRSLI
jgi:hypothetical protein